MARSLTIEIPEELYQPFAEIAAEQHRTVEDLSSEWLTRSIERVINDPVMQLAGCIHSGIPDLAERHDYYIGQQLMREMRGDDLRDGNE